MTADAVPQQLEEAGEKVANLLLAASDSILVSAPIPTDAGHPFIAARDREQAPVGEPPVPRAHNRLKRNWRLLRSRFVRPVQYESVSDTKVQSPRTLNSDVMEGWLPAVNALAPPDPTDRRFWKW